MQKCAWLRPKAAALVLPACTCLLFAADARGAAKGATAAAPPSDYARRQRPPTVPLPPPLARPSGFTAAELDAYRELLPDARRAQLAKLSDAVMQSPLAGVVRRLAARLDAERRRQEERAAPREGELFTYTLPNDPIIWLGSAKSFDGTVTALPRLARGAFAPPRPPTEPAPAPAPAAEDDWVFANPEQACTSGLAYTLVAVGSAFADLDNQPAPSGLAVHQMDLLAEIERQPSPFLHTADAAGAAQEAAPPPGDPVAPPKSAPDPVDPFAKLAAAGAASAGQAPSFEAFVAAVQAFYGPKHALLVQLTTELKSAEAALPGLRRACLAGGFRWNGNVSRGPGGKDIDLLSCTTAAGRRAGPGLRLVTGSGAYPQAVSIDWTDAASGLGAELRLAFDRETVALRALGGDEPDGPELLWDFGGAALGLNFNAAAAQRDAGPGYDVYEWYPGGSVKLWGHRRGGKPVGDERSWYASGALAGEVSFGDAGRMSAYKEWYENYRPAEETLLEGGRVSGLRRWWHENGVPAGAIQYLEGEPHGTARMWYDDATLGVTLTFKHGQPDGSASWWYEDGGPMFTGRFLDGKPDGAQKLFLPTGGELSERRYRRGEPEGAWVVYDVHGRPLRESTFKGGRRDGRAVLRFPGGQTFVELSWKAGLLDGPLHSYYRDGQQAASCLYEKDQLTQFSRYFPTGETALEGRVVDFGRGAVAFTVFHRDGQTALECTMKRFEIEACKVFGPGGQEARMPTDQELMGAVKAAGTTKAAGGLGSAAAPWRACGTYKKRFNYDPLINNRGNQFFASFESLADCPDRPASASLNCLLSLGEAGVKVEGCLAAGDEGGAPSSTAVTPAP